MFRIDVKLDTIEKIKKFISIVTKYDVDFDLISERYMVDAKSIMGVFSMNLSKPLTLQIHCNENDKIAQEIKSELSEFLI